MESMDERGLQGVVCGDSQIRPRVGDAAVLREGLERLGNRPREIWEGDCDVWENGLGLRQCGRRQSLPQ